MPADSPLLTRSFTIICLATFFFYLSFYLILPVMPLYVAAMGGTSFQIGLIIGLFAFVAIWRGSSASCQDPLGPDSSSGSWIFP